MSEYLWRGTFAGIGRIGTASSTTISLKDEMVGGIVLFPMARFVAAFGHSLV
jgi:hypothetical protein